jgi:hypothetical protein
MRVRNEYFSHVDEAVSATVKDPRAPNCRGFLLDNAGKVIGIQLVHVPIPSAPYELIAAELIDEYAAQGNTVVTVSVLNAEGVQTAERAFIAWPFPGLNAPESPAGPGNSSNEFAATSPYSPPDIGPLAFHVGDKDGSPLSDIVGGYGLPHRHHISGRVTFRERIAVIDPDPEPDPGPDPEPEPDGDALTRIAAAVERLAAHLGA